MFRSSTIIRELALNLAKVIFVLKHSVKLRRYLFAVVWQHTATHPRNIFLVAFAKSRKATVSFFMYICPLFVCLSICLFVGPSFHLPLRK